MSGIITEGFGLKKSFLTRIAVAVLCAVTCIAWNGCGKKTRSFQETGAEKTFAYITRDLQNDYWYDVIDGIENGLKDGDSLVVFDCEFDMDKEHDHVEEVLNGGFDGVFFTSADYSGSEKSLEALMKIGVPVVVIDASSVVKNKADAYIETDRYQAGYQSMSALAQEMGGKGNVLLFSDEANRERADGAKAALEEQYPKIVVLEECSLEGQDAYQIRMTVKETADRYLDADGIWFMNGLASDNGIAGLGERKILVADARSYDSSYYLIEDGLLLATTFDDPILHGEEAVKVMYRLYADGPLDERTVGVAPVVLDKKNIHEYVTEDDSGS